MGGRRPPKKFGRFASTCRRKNDFVVMQEKDLGEKRWTSATDEQDEGDSTKQKEKRDEREKREENNKKSG